MILPQQKDMFTKRYRTIRQREDECHSLHIPLVGILRWCMKPNVLWRHVPNGEHRDPATARKLKAMGVLPGSADLEFFYRDEKGLRVLFLELKLPGRKTSKAQQNFDGRVRPLGMEFLIAESIDIALNILRERKLLRDDVRVESLVYTS